ncbi:MAG: hypothetical protein J6V91_02130, partial [Kiritimatiellae bacterium]|nr:hypothetical protein [Kiritimatiellia bacterium]
STYEYVTINPSEWGITDQVSNQVKKMTPVDYLSAVEESALIALRAKASDKIVAAIKASDLTEKKTGVALDADYLKNIVLGFRAIKTKGAVVLYLAQADLLTLGKVRGANEKKALFEIYQRKFGPFRERREYLVAHPEEVEAVLQAGAEKARAQARITLTAARQAAGLD